MSTIELKDDMEITVDNCGIVTFIKEGKVCFVYLHPIDTAKLTKFLVESGYSFCT